jgi:hypothetical protein
MSALPVLITNLIIFLKHFLFLSHANVGANHRVASTIGYLVFIFCINFCDELEIVLNLISADLNPYKIIRCLLIFQFL